MKRVKFLKDIQEAFEVHPIVAILGPRQSGKTTLARQFIEKNPALPLHYFDLENPSDFENFENPKTILENLQGLIIIDEIQRRPNIFPVLRVLVDRDNNNQQYLILGSASPYLMQQSSETLAGRVEYMELTPFGYGEADDLDKLWLRGGFPRSYLADSDSHSFRWRENYIRAFLERDIPNLGIKIPAINIRRFWMMICHNHGNIFNAQEISKSMMLSQPTAKHYLDILSATFMVRQLPAWYENISKRQVRAPKVYIRDSGIFHSLLGLEDKSALLSHPKLGASWEGFALEEIINFHRLREQECFFWSIHGDAEIDLLTFQKSKRIAYEFKFSDAPKITRSIHTAIEALKLDKIFIIYPGDKEYDLSDKIKMIGLRNYLSNGFT